MGDRSGWSWGSSALRCRMVHDSVEDLVGYFLFGHEGEVVYLVVGVDEEDFVGVGAEAAAFGGDVVGYDEVEALLATLVRAFSSRSSLSAANPTRTKGRVAWARMSSVFSKSMLHWEELFLTLEDATDAGR